MPRSYRVDLAPEAEEDIRAARERIAHDRPQTATRWAQEVRRLVRSLKTFPERHEVIPEAPDVGPDYRHLLYGSYRIIYRVEPSRVIVVRVINAARELKRGMLPEA